MAEKIPFLISPVYPVPPIRAILRVKFRIAKFPWRVPSTAGSAKKLGALITNQSSLKPANSLSSIRRNMLLAKRLLQGSSVIVRTLVRYLGSAHT